MMTIHLAIRRILIGCLSGTVMLLLASGAFGAQEEKVIISYSSRDFSILPAHVALTKGFFKEEGLDPVMVQIRPPVAGPALMNGEIHYTTTFGSMLNAIMQGLPAKLLLPWSTKSRPITSLPGRELKRDGAPRQENCRAAARGCPIVLPRKRFSNQKGSISKMFSSSQSAATCRCV